MEPIVPVPRRHQLQEAIELSRTIMFDPICHGDRVLMARALGDLVEHLLPDLRAGVEHARPRATAHQVAQRAELNLENCRVVVDIANGIATSGFTSELRERLEKARTRVSELSYPYPAILRSQIATQLAAQLQIWMNSADSLPFLGPADPYFREKRAAKKFLRGEQLQGALKGLTGIARDTRLVADATEVVTELSNRIAEVQFMQKPRDTNVPLRLTPEQPVPWTPSTDRGEVDRSAGREGFDLG